MKKNNILTTENDSRNLVIGTKNERVEYEVTLSREEKWEQLREECKNYGLVKSEEAIKEFFNNSFDWNIGDRCFIVLKETKIEGKNIKCYSLFWNGTAQTFGIPELNVKFVNEGNEMGMKRIKTDKKIKPSEILVIESVFDNDMDIKPVMNVSAEISV